MAKNQSRRLSPALRESNEDAFNNFLKLADYKPANNEYVLEKVKKLFDKMNALQVLETQKEAELKAMRDDTAAAEWEFHNAMLAVKNQVKAQYGEDSNELQSLGIKKKSERKNPKPKK